MIRRLVYLLSLTLSCFCITRAEDPCVSDKGRALVLSGGGPKGAFEAGAAYHLVVHRNCDFHEFSGVSVGAINAAFLAQAAKQADAADSHAKLVAQSEALVSLWESITSVRQVAKGRRLAKLRFGLFGAESLNDFSPLRRLLAKSISLDKLTQGRPVRVGMISFWDGGYREILSSNSGSVSFLDYVFASAVPPVYGNMPRIDESGQGRDPKLLTQFADGGLRHDTPVVSYFTICKWPGPAGGGVPMPASDTKREGTCEQVKPFPADPHELPLQQLFVIVSNPYSRDSDRVVPVTDPKCCRPGSRQITNGLKIFGRTLSLMGDASYRWDLDFLLFANDMLGWRWQAYRDLVANTPPDRQAEAKRLFRSVTALPVESYNRVDPKLDPEAPSLPYDIGLVAPEKQFAEVANLLVFSRKGTRTQLYCGCMAADKMMQKSFQLVSVGDKCTERFPPLPEPGKSSAQASAKKWDPTVCQQTIRPM